MKYFVLLAGYGEMPLWDELTPEEQEAGMAREVFLAEVSMARGKWWSTVIYGVLEHEYAKLRNAQKG